MITRALTGALAKSKKSVLLLGPRQTGKSTLMRSLEPDLSFNLARESTFLEFARNPKELEQRLDAARGVKTVFINEVQRLPSLLNTIQAVLDEGAGYRFLLTGSSARKLRRGQANLLPGRIHSFKLGPVVSREMSYALPTPTALSLGTLPAMISAENRSEAMKTLRSYAATYLKEEIQAESLTRDLEGFARFITASAELSGYFLDISKLATTAQVSRQSVTRWLEVLEDTLLARRVSSFAKSATRRLVQHPKLYYFDVGVLNGLLGNFEASADRIGFLFEHLVCSQLFDSAAAADVDIRVSNFRTEHGAEVDFIVEHQGRTWALELKVSQAVHRTDLRGLASFADYLGKKHEPRVWYLGTASRVVEGVKVLPWQEGLRELGL